MLKSSPHIICTPRADGTPEAESDTLAAVYRFVLFGSQASKGGLHDLTNDQTTETEDGSRTKEQENA